MPAKADLHIHSTASDGKMRPEEIVSVAAGLNLSLIALTDHDTISGVEKARQTAKNYDLKVMNGVEFTASFEEREIHVLAYDFNIQNKELVNCLRDHQKARVVRAKLIIKSLQNEGIQLNIDEVLAEARIQNVCRPHIAAVLVSKGYVSTIREAFIRYLSDEALGSIKNNYHTLEEIIAVVKEAGGVIIVAHPGRLYDKQQLNKFVDMGIDGLETVHPSHSYEMQKQLEDFAKPHNLLTTGGSDFHGKIKKYYRHFGVVGITMERVKMIERITNYRKSIVV